MKPKFFSTERGQALILITFAAIGLFAIVGLAIDGGAKFSDRRHSQNAADTAALAGSLSNLRGATDWEIVAKDQAGSNGYTGDLVHNQIWVYNCGLSKADPKRSTVPNGIDCGPYEGDSYYVQVVIRSYVRTYFARVIGITQTENIVQAIAMSAQAHTSQLYNGASIIGLAPDQCKTIWISGSSDITVTGGGIFSNSKLDCGVTIQGSGKGKGGLDIATDSSISMVADSYNLNGTPYLGDIAGGLSGGANQYDYPPPSWMFPSYTCDYTYANFPPSGVTDLSPGTYCVTSRFKMNAGDKLTGTGVTIVMLGSSDIDWDGHATINLSAPTSGNLAGMLFFAPMSNPSTMKFNGNASSNLTGTIFMPAAPIVYNGTGNLTPSHVQIIGYTVEVNGSNTTAILYQDADNWDATVPAQVGIMQ